MQCMSSNYSVVVGGILLVGIVILTAVIIVVCRKKCNREEGKLVSVCLQF